MEYFLFVECQNELFPCLSTNKEVCPNCVLSPLSTSHWDNCTQGQCTNKNWSVQCERNWLNLSNNKINYIPTEIVDGLESLKKINLNNNPIQALPENMFDKSKK